MARVCLTKSENFKGYFAHLTGHDEEMDHLVDTITINVTEFFRDPKVFSVMKPGGLGAIKSIMEFDPLAKIIIISVLDGNQEDVVEGIRLGALSYLPKPINRNNLIRETERILNI